MSSVNVDSAGQPRTNWAGNIVYSAADLYRPATVNELRGVVARAGRIRVLATGHSFNDLADSPGAQVSLADLPSELEVDSAAGLVRVAAGLSYAQLGRRLDDQGFALRNLASLPHISVAGACATATHGSGWTNQNLAASIAALHFVTADGDLVEIGRGDDTFPGAVVHLGALGVVTHLDLEVVPSFDVSQWVYEDLPLEVLDDHFADIMSAGYSVSMFTDWRAPRLTQTWIKQRVEDTHPYAAPAPQTPETLQTPQTPQIPQTPHTAAPPSLTEAPWFTATPAPAPRNPVPGVAADNCTQQLGVPGRWYDRLPHFRPDFTPSVGDELQSEYLLPVEHAVPAIHALNQISDSLAPVLQICEFRVIAADELWLSTCYRQDSVAFHFTWQPDLASVLPVVTLIEQQLAPFAARPHWGKVFSATPETLHARYERLPDFLALARHYDPVGKFRNAYTARYLAR
jgi:xylitol oxidase